MKSESKNRLASPIYALGLAFATTFLAGCQATSNSYLADPKAGFLKREAAQTELCLDATFPRTTSLACERIGDHAKRILPNIVDVVSRAPAIVAVDPAAGRYFGNQYHPPMINVNRGYSGSTEHPGRALALHPVNWLLTSAESLSRLSSDLFGVVTQTGNLFLQPLYFNTSTREKWFNDSTGNNPHADRLKLALDGATDVVKGPVRTLFYVFGSDITPDSLKYALDGMRNWEGYAVGERMGKLEQKFAEGGNPQSNNGLRTAVNAIPLVDKPLDEVWGTTYRRDYGDTVSTTIPGSIPASQSSDWQWYRHLRGDESMAPGIIITNNGGNSLFHPNEPLFLGLARGAWTIATPFIHLGGSSGSSSTNIVPTSGGGRTSGWSTGQ